MLEQDLQVLLATTFGMAVKAQRYHWNVVDPRFSQLHDFYEEIYDDLYEHVDIIAETIRTLGAYPIGSLAEFTELSQIAEEDEVITDGHSQLAELDRANQVTIRIIKIAMTAADDEDAEDVEDLLVNRLRAHKKHGWMIKAHMAA